jgi:hypothetical protein
MIEQHPVFLNPAVQTNVNSGISPEKNRLANNQHTKAATPYTVVAIQAGAEITINETVAAVPTAIVNPIRHGLHHVRQAYYAESCFPVA